MELRNKLQPTHMSPFHGWLYFQPALHFGHEKPTKPQLSLYRHRKIIYSSKEQFAAEDDTSPKLTDASIKRVKDIVGALLYYTRAINNIILVGISMIGDQEAAATEKTAAALDQLLDHVATYPDYGIIYWASDIILAAHSDTGLNNDSKERNHAGAHIFLSKDEPTSKWNGAVLTISQIIKFVMSSAAEANLGAL